MSETLLDELILPYLQLQYDNGFVYRIVRCFTPPSHLFHEIELDYIYKDGQRHSPPSPHNAIEVTTNGSYIIFRLKPGNWVRHRWPLRIIMRFDVCDPNIDVESILRCVVIYLNESDISMSELRNIMRQYMSDEIIKNLFGENS